MEQRDCHAQETGPLIDEDEYIVIQDRCLYDVPRSSYKLRAANHKLGRYRVSRLKRTAGPKAKPAEDHDHSEIVPARPPESRRTCCSR